MLDMGFGGAAEIDHPPPGKRHQIARAAGLRDGGAEPGRAVIGEPERAGPRAGALKGSSPICRGRWGLGPVLPRSPAGGGSACWAGIASRFCFRETGLTWFPVSQIASDEEFSDENSSAGAGSGLQPPLHLAGRGADG